jgi:hypothetical protein
MGSGGFRHIVASAGNRLRSEQMFSEVIVAVDRSGGERELVPVVRLGG